MNFFWKLIAAGKTDVSHYIRKQIGNIVCIYRIHNELLIIPEDRGTNNVWNFMTYLGIVTVVQKSKGNISVTKHGSFFSLRTEIYYNLFP